MAAEWEALEEEELLQMGHAPSYMDESSPQNLVRGA